MDFDHILMIGFGAPEKQKDIPEFLRIVTKGTPVPEERLKAVEHHYEAIGGGSPYTKHAAKIAEGLKQKLAAQSISLPVFTGMRNWHPFLKETLAEIKSRGLRKGIGVVLASHRSDASWDKYLRNVEEAKKEAGAEVQYDYLGPWYDHPGFIAAQAERVRDVKGDGAHLLFTAHSIPVEMAEKSSYAEEIRISSELTAKQLNQTEWSLAYQSRSGNPRQPWLGPDVNSIFPELASGGVKTAVLVPIGFLCENAEVLYDLDIEAKAEAEKQGVRYLRASTVMDHPSFIAALAELIQEKICPKITG